MAVAVGSEKLWMAFCTAIERPDLATHPDFEDNAARIRNRGVLEPLLANIFSKRPAAEWIARLGVSGIPCSLVHNFREVAAHPQCEARGMFPVLDHSAAGPHKVTGTPVKLSDTPGKPTIAAPLLGEHTRCVLKEMFALDDRMLDDLAARRIILEAGSS